MKPTSQSCRRWGDSAPEFIDGMLKAIVGIEIEVLSLEGKSKLSQNREERDLKRAIDVLAERDNGDLSGAMAQALKKLIL